MKSILKMYSESNYKISAILNKKIRKYDGKFKHLGPFCLLLDYSVCHL